MKLKRRLLLGRKVMTNLDSILKSRDITLLTKVHLVIAMVFPVVMYGCESWTIKKTECRRIDAFELGCWRRLLRVPWTPRRSSQSILKEISPGCSLEGLMLKLKLQTLGLLTHQAAKPTFLYPRKVWHLLQVLSTEYGQLMLKSPELLDGFQGSVCGRRRGWDDLRG